MANETVKKVATKVKPNTDVNFGDLADRIMKLAELYVPIAIAMERERHEMAIAVQKMELKLHELEFMSKLESGKVELRQETASAAIEEIRLETAQMELEETKKRKAQSQGQGRG
jgi:hypothetical protein